MDNIHVVRRLLKFPLEFWNNRSGFLSHHRGFSRSLNTNIRMTINPETPGAQNGGYPRRLLEFCSELLKNLLKLTGRGFLRSPNNKKITTVMIPVAPGAY